MNESSLRKIINTNLERSTFGNIFNIVLWITVVICILGMPIFIINMHKLGYIFVGNRGLLGVMIYMVSITTILIPMFGISYLPEYILREFIKQGEIIDGIMINELDSISDVSKILSTTAHVYKRSRVSYFLSAKFFFLFSKPLRRGITLYHQETIQSAVTILTDLRSDLATRLTEQRQILESAKTEVEKNITGTSELIAVSEVQQMRLDRQIEQFEELQRVLVRV